MKKIVHLSLMLTAMAFCFGHGSAANAQKRASSRNIEGAWQIAELQGKPVETGEEIPYVNFNLVKKSMNGFAGCNYIHGSFQLNAKKRHLQFGAVASTRMACPHLELESKVLLLLQQTASYRVEAPQDANDRLTLLAQDGSVLMKLARMMPLDGRWTVSKVYDAPVPEESEVFLVFNSTQNMVYGNLGCNTYNASLEYNPQKKSLVKFGNGLTTLRLCEEMETESQLLKAFQDIVSYKKFSDHKAILCDTGGKVLVELTR
ncbi:MAG: META domain-containing protein [Bacteroides sp.]|nr:META domain-containing protein [Bacteroides sp.]MCM1085042.1 META domain-containing protein [Bacteroides sp.]